LTLRLRDEYDVSCTVCFEAFHVVPITFNCGHTICNDCGQNSAAAEILRACPVCRDPVTKRTRNRYFSDLLSNPKSEEAAESQLRVT
ncbi:hypothetical protein PFISCL1PPCAC_26411, partial [Pristionchus fissidentatus]